MKKLKKNPKLQLEKFSTIFTQLGLVLVLFIVFLALEHETKVTESEPIVYSSNEKILDFEPDIPIIRREIEVQQKELPKNTEVKFVDDVQVVNNDHKEIENKVIIQPKDEPIITTKTPNFGAIEEDDEIIEDVKPISIKFVQKAPVFKGCEGLSEKENRVCFENKMKRLIQRHFNAGLGNELGLRSGKNKILTQFVIDKTGNITDVQIRAPHPRLKKEANRVINKIPKFKPGIQNDKPAKVRYTLPISFMVE